MPIDHIKYQIHILRKYCLPLSRMFRGALTTSEHITLSVPYRSLKGMKNIKIKWVRMNESRNPRVAFDLE